MEKLLINPSSSSELEAKDSQSRVSKAGTHLKKRSVKEVEKGEKMELRSKKSTAQINMKDQMYDEDDIDENSGDESNSTITKPSV